MPFMDKINTLHNCISFAKYQNESTTEWRTSVLNELLGSLLDVLNLNQHPEISKSKCENNKYRISDPKQKHGLGYTFVNYLYMG